MRSTGARLQIVRDELPGIPARAKVGLVVADKRVARAASRVVRASSAVLVADNNLAAALRWLDESDVDVLIVDGDAIQAAPVSFASLMARRDLPALVFLSGAILDANLMRVGHHCQHVVAKVAHASAPEMASLLTTLRKILDRDIFGIEKYMSWGSTVHTVRVSGSAHKQDALNVFDEFLDQLDCDVRYRQSLLVVADELLTNALFRAPTTSDGRRRFAGCRRGDKITLAPHEAPALDFTTDGRRVAVSVRDPFGAIVPDEVLAAIQESSRNCRSAQRGGQTDPASNDPPMGLYIAYRALDQLIINVEPGVTSEVIGVLDVTERYRIHRSRPKSVHVFTLRSLEPSGGGAAQSRTTSAAAMSELEVAALREVDRVKREMVSLRQREALSRDELDRKDELVVQVAHELRNTIAPLRYGLELHEAPSTPPVLQRMDLHLTHMERILEDLVDLSRANLGVVELVRSHVEIGALVARALEMSGVGAAASGADRSTAARHVVKTELPSEPLVVYADETRLLQILVNLLQNAAKFTPAGGTICVRAAQEHGDVVLEVADSGVGIARDMIERVFEPFARLDRSSWRTVEGLGIGLTVVKKLAELHGGQVFASSGGMGAGSTFCVRLPRGPAVPTRPARP